MKNLCSIVLSAVILVFTLCIGASADTFREIDCRDGRFDSEQLAQLEEKRLALAEKTGWNICIVISDGFGDKSPMEFCDDYYDEHYPLNSDGVMFLYDMEERYISTSGDAINYLNDIRIEYMLDHIENCYYDSRDYDAVECFLTEVETYYDKGIADNQYIFKGEYQGSKFKEQYEGEKIERILIIYFVSIFSVVVICLIVVGSVRHRYKVHAKPQNNNYLDKDSVKYYRFIDQYVTTRVSRTRISSESSGGGRGGYGGSSTHSSSSGASHGGGGRSGRR